MKYLKNLTQVKISLLLAAVVIGTGFIGCGPSAVRPGEKQLFAERNKFIECKPAGEYNIPQLKYKTEDSETMYLTMAGGTARPAGIQFRDIHSGEVKKIYFGEKTSRKYRCELAE